MSARNKLMIFICIVIIVAISVFQFDSMINYLKRADEDMLSYYPQACVSVAGVSCALWVLRQNVNKERKKWRAVLLFYAAGTSFGAIGGMVLCLYYFMQ